MGWCITEATEVSVRRLWRISPEGETQTRAWVDAKRPCCGRCEVRILSALRFSLTVRDALPHGALSISSVIKKVSELEQCPSALFVEGGICPPDAWTAGVTPNSDSPALAVIIIHANVATTPLSQSTLKTKIAPSVIPSGQSVCLLLMTPNSGLKDPQRKLTGARLF